MADDWRHRSQLLPVDAVGHALMAGEGAQRQCAQLRVTARIECNAAAVVEAHFEDATGVAAARRSQGMYATLLIRHCHAQT
ncbi:hypothetical protein XHV734_0937 [Xanthomonas hortorum pv. vitians]|nr:hypothetical protein XHV734_0937 [Xanthomonas hortorum pv. vitians]